jgi:hypothetical protein
MKCRAILPVVLVVAVLGLLAGALPAGAQSEKILNFKSVVVVHPDASMTVTEYITVKATGREIKWRMVRVIPTIYRDQQGNIVRAGFEVLAVLRDGQTEPYHIGSYHNGVSIKIGQKETFLRPGVYTYTIKYRMDRTLEFCKDFDELCWDVTGIYHFPIDRAEAVIKLPPGAKILRSNAYTGNISGNDWKRGYYSRDRGQDVTVKPGDRDIVFTTTRGLAPNERLTIAVAWPKGVVHEPRILNFKSVVVVHPDASMTVTEDITVKATGREIEWGMVRYIPTTYRNPQGTKSFKVGFELLAVLRDGQTEPYHIGSYHNGVKIYLGQTKGFLPLGIYTYTIRYRVDRELAFLKDYDELVWNVTGNRWTFPIDRAEAVIQLPPGAKILKYAGYYTGYQGDRGGDFTVQAGDRDIAFKTTRGLGPTEGLTIWVAWPKGVVHEPSGLEKADFFLPENLLPMTVGSVCLSLLLGFYLWAWHRVGRDPAKGTIIPLFSPPRGFSPAGVRFVSRMGFDDKTFAVALVDMAVKGAVQIQEDGSDYTLVRRVGGPPLSRGEQRIAARLFPEGASIKLVNENHTRIKSAIDALKKNLNTELEKIYFATNSGYLAAGIGITLLGAPLVALMSQDIPQIFWIFMLMIILTVVGCYYLAVKAYQRWRALSGGFGLDKLLAALGRTFALLLLFYFGIIWVRIYLKTFSVPVLVIPAAMAFLNALFYHLLKAPTLSGRKIVEQIEGFKLFLSVAKTPELFEKYLPYALALDMENAWSEQLAALLAPAGTETQPYTPVWYSGPSWDEFHASRFADSLGSSFAAAISHSSLPPDSSYWTGGG